MGQTKVAQEVKRRSEERRNYPLGPGQLIAGERTLGCRRTWGTWAGSASASNT